MAELSLDDLIQPYEWELLAGALKIDLAALMQLTARELFKRMQVVLKENERVRRAAGWRGEVLS